MAKLAVRPQSDNENESGSESDELPTLETLLDQPEKPFAVSNTRSKSPVKKQVANRVAKQPMVPKQIHNMSVSFSHAQQQKSDQKSLKPTQPKTKPKLKSKGNSRNLFIDDEASESANDSDSDAGSDVDPLWKTMTSRLRLEPRIDSHGNRFRRSSPNRMTKHQNIKDLVQSYRRNGHEEENDSDEGEEEDEGFTDLSGFIVDDDVELSLHESELSYSESDLGRRGRTLEKPPENGREKRLVRGRDLKKRKSAGTDDVGSLAKGLEVIDLTKSPPLRPQPEPDDSISKDLFEPEILKTPPASPTKPCLKSPSKSPRKPIPPTPHRQSNAAFWSSDLTNEWNDQYSPIKESVLTSPRKKDILRFILHSDDEDDHDDEDRAASPSPTKFTTSPIKSPSKKSLQAEKRAIKLARQSFEAQKHELAISFLDALDDRITESQLKQLTQSTGGIMINWSNTLRSTAGRAHWRCTTIKTNSSSSNTSDGPSPSFIDLTQQQGPAKKHHHASIELASKVITTRTRLLNTLAHEFCHLANFILSNETKKPHGPSFKMWANKVTKAFARDAIFCGEDREKVVVTTTHSYDIEFKYRWVCAGKREKPMSVEELIRGLDDAEGWEGFVGRLADDGCGETYGRHSKSVDPRTARCGKCEAGMLVQVKPRPRRQGSPEKKREVSQQAVGGV